jgi:hypothetical protein
MTKIDVEYTALFFIALFFIILAFIVWKVFSLVMRRGKKMSDAAIVGDSAIHRKFLASHVPFLIEFGELQKLADKIFSLALEKCNRPLDKEPDGADSDQLAAFRLVSVPKRKIAHQIRRFSHFCRFFLHFPLDRYMCCMAHILP